MSLTKEDIAQIEAIVIKVLKSCDSIGHNWMYKSTPGESPYAKQCTRCEKYVCDYELEF